MNTQDYIIVDPKICHGKPCFKNTRVMVHTVLELLAGGIKPEEITEDKYYPQLTDDHIRAALHYAAAVSEAGELVEFAA